MDPLLTTAELRALVRTPLSDEDLELVIEREEEALIARLGPHYDPAAPLVEVVEGEGGNVFLSRPISAVVEVVETASLGGSPAIVTTAGYFTWAGQGRLVRLPEGKHWGKGVTVTYQPVDDTLQRKALLIELVRLGLERTAMKSESVAGEYSYTAPDWNAERRALLRQHGFRRV